jgi:hypothetical protein
MMACRRFRTRLFVVLTTAADGPSRDLKEASMRYLLLIYNTEPAEQVPADVMATETEAYNAFTSSIREKGILEAGEALQPTATATTVRVENGRTVTTDGPFAETKEQLGGFYLVQCRDIDEAIELAARIPGATHGSIEIRPIWDLPSGSSAEAVAVAG